MIKFSVELNFERIHFNLVLLNSTGSSQELEIGKFGEGYSLEFKRCPERSQKPIKLMSRLKEGKKRSREKERSRVLEFN